VGGHGAGRVEKSSVDNTLIQFQDSSVWGLEIIMMDSAVDLNQDLMKMIIVQVDIVVIAENDGKG
jgi:hypothetical protein